MKILQLNQLGSSIDDLKQSFDSLPHTDHKDGKYRLRRYSVIELRTTFWNAKEEAEITRLDHREFKQSEELNKHQGGMARNFEEIKDSDLQGEGMKEICLGFKRANRLVDGQEIEIHQMRVVTQEDGTAKVSPEGVHQDGFDYIAMVGVNRYNVHGGELLVYDNKKSNPFVQRALNDGEMIMLNDGEVWHNATPIVAGKLDEKGWADWFILCANKT